MEIESFKVPVSLLATNPRRCPVCGAGSRVYSCTPPQRYRKCLKCGTRWKTAEVHYAAVEILQIAQRGLPAQEEEVECG